MPDLPEGAAPNSSEGGEGQQQEFTPPASQAELDRIIQDRIARERNKFSDYEDLRAKATEYEQFKDQSKSEQERAIDAAKAEAANETAGKFTKRIVNAEIKATAAALGFSDPGDAIALFGDVSKVEITDDGPDADAIKSRLGEIAEQKPYLLKSDGGQKVATRPKPKRGSDTDTSKPAGKARAAAALRELSGNR